MNCKWVLTVVDNKRVRLTFLQFVLESGDKVRIYDGNSKKSPHIVSYRKGDSPTDVVSSGSSMTVNVITDRCGQNRLIIASFKAIDCGNLFYVKQGIRKSVQIQSPRFPQKYPNNLDCIWMFVSSGHSLLSARVNIEVVGTAGSGDKLIIQKSLEVSRSDSQVHEYYGKTKRNKALTFRNTPGFKIKFVSDREKRGKGFSLNVVVHAHGLHCPIPKSFRNGFVSLINFGRTAKYDCCDGYKLYGSNMRSCSNRRWTPSNTPICKSVSFCTLPSNMKVSNGSTNVAIGVEVRLYCTRGYKLSNSLKLLPALCDCNGKWNITTNPSPCKDYFCTSPPPPPTPGGVTLFEDDKNIVTFPVGSRVNYTCPDGYGLDGILYRVCTEDLDWEPHSKIHNCQKNLQVCLDPGVPENGIRRTKSFAEGRLASFSCKPGFTYHGTDLRTCKVDEQNNTFWDGEEGYCESDFKSPLGLAFQLKETFTDRVGACVIDNSFSTSTVETPIVSASTVELNLPNEADNNLSASPDCRGRTVVVGEGCIDLIYIVDCSKSVGEENFHNSLDFVGRSAALFNINNDTTKNDTARVALITYDHKVYPIFNLGEKATLVETINAINKTKFCGGATAIRKVLKFVIEKVIPLARQLCKIILFLFSDGVNNWAGDPMKEAKALKEEKGIEIYTIAFGVGENIRVDSKALESIATNPSYHFKVQDASSIRDALKKAFTTKVDFCKTCGRAVAPKCRNQRNGVCLSETGAWPWMVAIYRIERGNPVFHCGGVVISERMILTAAHCLFGRNITELLVVVGDTQRFVKEFSEKTYKIKQVFIHQEYDPISFNRDIALLMLYCDITCSPYVRKVCLPTANDTIYYRPGTECIVAGWGATERRELGGNSSAKSTAMKELHLPIADKTICINSTSPQFQSDVTNYTVCAGDGTGNNDACDGDSGGPLFTKRNKEKEIDDDSYVVVGIVSWGEGCGQPRKYGIFAHLLNLMDWVKNVMDLNKFQLAPDDSEEEHGRHAPKTQLY
ncbi:complement C2-like isoform X2 [Corticium candelabrum]|nr:complement C2-like isoform X2 [Corticium candelabrum]